MIVRGIDYSRFRLVEEQDIGVHDGAVNLRAQRCLVATVRNQVLPVFRIAKDQVRFWHQRFNCHGLTFETHKSPVGPLWIDNPAMFQLISDTCRRVTSRERVQRGDIILWYEHGMAEHTARIDEPIYVHDGLSSETVVISKNGLGAVFHSRIADLPPRAFQVWRFNFHR